MPRQLTAFRIPTDLVDWLASRGERTKQVVDLLRAQYEQRLVVLDAPDAGLVETLLAALRERRLVLAAAPAPHDPNTGTDYPVLVCMHQGDPT